MNAQQHDKQFQMRVSDDFLRMVDDWRRKQEGLPSRAEAIRILVELGIANYLQIKSDTSRRK